jgi:hypothetical protein
MNRDQKTGDKQDDYLHIHGSKVIVLSPVFTSPVFTNSSYYNLTLIATKLTRIHGACSRLPFCRPARFAVAAPHI